MKFETKSILRDGLRAAPMLHNAVPIKRLSASRNGAHPIEPRALSKRELEDSHLIHRDLSVRGPTDAFRKLRMRLLALAGDDIFKTLVVAVSSGSGGSFMARNLAAAFAFDESKPVVLIDGNGRRPAQHSALGVTPDAGLGDYLGRSGSDLDHVLYDTGVARVRLIPAGHPPETSAECFSSPRMRALLDALRERYANHYIVLDAPALRSAPDAHVLADLADYIVVVAAYGRDTAATIDQAVFGLDPAKIAGVVFNYPP